MIQLGALKPKRRVFGFKQIPPLKKIRKTHAQLANIENNKQKAPPPVVAILLVTCFGMVKGVTLSKVVGDL